MRRDGKLGCEIVCLASVIVPMFAIAAYVATKSDKIAVPLLMIGVVFAAFLTLAYTLYQKN